MERKYAKYLLDKTRQDYNQIADSFSRARGSVWKDMEFLFNNYLTSGERVLDLGCGNGRFLELFKRKNIDYIGADNSRKLIEIANSKYKDTRHKIQDTKYKFIVADALKLPFSNSYFDKIYSIATLHHIPSQELRMQFLKEAQRTLKPEGILILTVWNLWSKPKFRKVIFKSALSKIFGKSKLDFKDIIIPWWGMPQYYFHCFTKSELERLVRKAGFRIKKIGEIIIPQGKNFNSNFYIIADKVQL